MLLQLKLNDTFPIIILCSAKLYPQSTARDKFSLGVPGCHSTDSTKGLSAEGRSMLADIRQYFHPNGAHSIDHWELCTENQGSVKLPWSLHFTQLSNSSCFSVSPQKRLNLCLDRSPLCVAGQINHKISLLTKEDTRREKSLLISSCRAKISTGPTAL